MLSTESRDFLKGIILADRTDMDAGISADFTKTGLVHFWQFPELIWLLFSGWLCFSEKMLSAKIKKYSCNNKFATDMVFCSIYRLRKLSCQILFNAYILLHHGTFTAETRFVAFHGVSRISNTDARYSAIVWYWISAEFSGRIWHLLAEPTYIKLFA